MKIHEIKVYQEFDAAIEQTWEAFNDHANFGKMLGQKITRIVDSSDPQNINGLGSVRLIGLPIGSFEETIVRSEKPDVIEYKITRGTPLHYHHGRIQFTALPGGRSAVNYSIDLGSKYPLIGVVLKGVLAKGIGGALANHARRLKKK